MRVYRSGVRCLLAVMFAALSSVPAYATFGYTDIYCPPAGEKTHSQILGEDIYGGTFTADGLNFVGSGDSAGITAIRVYDFDGLYTNTTHVYNHGPNDVDQIWTDGVVTVTAYAKYASHQQAFGWNGGGTHGNVFEELVDYLDIDNDGHTFQISEGQKFLWGHQAKGNPKCGYWEFDEEWWSLESENGWCGYEEDHMVTYYMQGVSATEAVWVIFIEDVAFNDGSDRDYNDFVVEIRAIPEPVTLVLLAAGGLLLRRNKS